MRISLSHLVGAYSFSRLHHKLLRSKTDLGQALEEEPRKVRIGRNWAWKWRDWVSPEFGFLEQRPWTPIAIDNRLCFVASENPALNGDDGVENFDKSKWRVVWGEELGPWFDDVYGLTEFCGKPVYIARTDNGSTSQYCVVWWHRKSENFPHQISVNLSEECIRVSAFDAGEKKSEIEVIENWIEL